MDCTLRRLTIIFSIFVVFSPGCKSKEQASIIASYVLVQSTGANNNTDDFQQSIIDADVKQTAEALTLFEDKTYTIINEGRTYTQGNWNYTEKLKSIVFASDFVDQKKKVGTIDLTKKPYIITIINKELNQKSIYSGQAYADSIFKNHPYYPANNSWRIRPLTKETDGQIRERLALYLKQMALILKSSLYNNSDVISFQFSRGPVAIYSGGIGAFPFETVNPNWKAVFFDEEDAKKAFQFYTEAIKSASTPKAGTGEWVEDDYRILLSIYGSLLKSGNAAVEK